ncbi:MAG: hypothetical protein AB7S75_13325 [Desulfococcaceae bacterium]
MLSYNEISQNSKEVALLLLGQRQAFKDDSGKSFTKDVKNFSSVFSSKALSLYSLNDGNGKGEKGFQTVSGAVPFSVPIPQEEKPFPFSGPDILGSISSAFFSDFFSDLSGLRDYLNSLLVKKFGHTLSNRDSDFLILYRDYARSVFSVSDSKNFDYCHYNKRKGKAFISKKDNGKIVYPYIPRCSEKGCLRCDSYERDKVLREWIDFIENITYYHKSDFPGIYTGVFDLPSEIESVPLYDRSVAEKLIRGIQDIYRRAFGCKYDKAGVGNIGFLAFEHPCGDSDLFRDRWHLHVDVIPAVISEKDWKKYSVKGGLVRWLSLSDDAKRKDRDVLGHIDPAWLLGQWVELLSEVFPGRDFSGLRKSPQWGFIPNNKDVMKRVNHRLLYDGRRFSEDVRRCVVRTGCQEHIFVVRCSCGWNRDSGRPEYYFWRIVKAEDFVVRYAFLRDSCRMHTRGWCRQRSRYQKYFCGLVLVQKTVSFRDLLDPEKYAEVDLDVIETLSYKLECRKLLKIIDVSYIFFNPFSGRVEVRTKDQMSVLRI